MVCMKSAIDGKQCLGYGLYEQWCRQAEMLRRWAWSMWRLTLLTLSARAKKLTVMRILFVEQNTPPPNVPHVLVDFVVFPPGHGRSVTDF